VFNHFDVVQVPYYLQMLRAALVAAVQVLRIHQARRYGMAISPLQSVIAARWLKLIDMAFLFLGFMAVGVSAGRDPVMPRDEVLMVIRLTFLISAVAGIVAETIMLTTMVRSKHGGPI
jgi:hypothetical protein